MKFEMELKPGDIKLLKFLACVLIIFFCVQFLIIPALHTNQNLADEKDQVDQKKQEMQMTIESAKTLDATIAKQQEKLKALSTGYYDLMENQQVDELLTGIALNNSLMPVYLKIEGTEAKAPGTYQNLVLAESSDASLGTSADTSSDTSDTSSDSSDTSDTSDSDAADSEDTDTTEEIYQYINTTQVSMTLQGTETEFRNFLNNLSKDYPGVQLLSFNVSENTYVDENLQTVSENNYQCVLAVYTCGELEKTQEADVQ